MRIRLCLRMGLYVSGRKKNAKSERLVATITVIHIVHLQPRELWIMKVPDIGPITGPMKPIKTKQSIAMPRLTGELQKSVSAPPVTAMEEEPKAPLKNRQTRIVDKFLARAMGMQKSAKRASPIISGYLLPIFSDKGPQTSGPKANP